MRPADLIRLVPLAAICGGSFLGEPFDLSRRAGGALLVITTTLLPQAGKRRALKTAD